MWKKPDTDEPQPQPSLPPRNPESQPRGERATIGPTIYVKGDVSGDEDLIIQGRVEGKIDLRRYNVTVGKNGRLKADIYGKIISIDGEVEGNLYGEEQLILRQSGTVRGNITAPRVILEDGSNFKGSIDMSPKNVDERRAAQTAGTDSKTQAVDTQKTLKITDQAQPVVAGVKTERGPTRI